jgi:hypothetical protein
MTAILFLDDIVITVGQTLRGKLAGRNGKLSPPPK